MGNTPTTLDPFETRPNNGLNEGTTRRQLITWLATFLAARATGVLGQNALPRTYDEIMAALAEWKLTHKQLFDICAQNANNFNETQRTALRWELAKLKLQENKPLASSNKPPLNETRAEKEAREAREKEQKMATSSAKTLRANILESENWKPEAGNKLKFTVKPWKGIKFEGDKKDLELSHEAKISFTTVIAPGTYDITMSSNVDSNDVSLYLFSGDAGKWAIAMNGSPILDGETKCVQNFASGKKMRIQIPKNCKSAMFQITLTGGNKIFEMDGIEIQPINETNLFVNQ